MFGSQKDAYRPWSPARRVFYWGPGLANSCAFIWVSEALLRTPPPRTLPALGATLALFLLFGLGAVAAAIALRDLTEAGHRVTRMWIRHRRLLDKVQRVHRLNLERRQAAAVGGFGPDVKSVIAAIAAVRRELGLIKRESARAELVQRRGLVLEFAGAVLFLGGLSLAVGLRQI